MKLKSLFCAYHQNHVIWTYKRVEKLSWHINNSHHWHNYISMVTFPQNFKEARVGPLLKNTSLPKNKLKNYGPPSNFSFISKILENVVDNRLQAHIKHNHLSNLLQSAYITGNIILQNWPYWKYITISLCIMDKGEVTALTLLDSPAAFDTI